METPTSSARTRRSGQSALTAPPAANLSSVTPSSSAGTLQEWEPPTATRRHTQSLIPYYLRPADVQMFPKASLMAFLLPPNQSSQDHACLWGRPLCFGL